MSVLSDRLLAERASGGDVLAFEVLVRRYQLRVLRLCIGMLGDQHAAEDAAQDAFFSAWRSMGQFRGDAQFSTWLYRIATNQCLRAIRRRPAPTVELPENMTAAEGTPHSQLEAAEAVAAVSAAVARLSPEQRVALLLREVEGLSYDQIAEVLGVSMAAVKSRIYHARVELARDLSDRGLDSR